MVNIQLKTQLLRWGPLTILALAALVRLFNLGYPGVLVFDETYYVKDAYSLLTHGVELNWTDSSDAAFAKGDPSGLTNDPSFVVHPPLGKWLIGLGILVFGSGNPFGWRIVVALLSIASVWLTMKCAERMFQSKVWALVAGLFYAIDGVGIVLGRTALLDQILGFFAILAFYFLLRDLDDPSKKRPWLFLMGVTLGLATAVKWSGLYFLAIFALYRALVEVKRNYVFHKKLEIETDQKLEKRLWIIPSLLGTVKTFVWVTVPAFVIYLVSWTGWFLSPNGYDRSYAETHPASGIFNLIPKALQSLWHYHAEIYNFHANLHAQHDYASNPLTWPFMLRPTSFFWQERGSDCLFDTASQNCASAITPLGNPLIWWGAFITSSVLIGSWFRTRDRLTTLIFIGIIAGYVPWLLLMNRTVFEFYVISFLPWIIFILVFGLKTWYDNSPKPNRARWLISGFVGLVCLISVFFLPIWTGIWISYDFWHVHMWLPSWI
ncbi:MAG: phospholipid carrier-dependent glycosyltransferase [Micrococcales bacterium]|nr:phospholipid carrier-dependent glycosyltransferase [Micrococcales bacterium]